MTTTLAPALDPGLDLARRRAGARLLLRSQWLQALHRERAHLSGSALAVAVSLADTPEEERRHHEERHPDLLAEVLELDRASATDSESVLGTVCARLGLEQADRDLIELTAAVALDPRLGPVLADLAGRPDLVQVTTATARRVLGLAAWPTAALRWGLVHTATVCGTETVAIDPHTLDVLAAGRSIDPRFGERAEIVTPAPAFAAWPVQGVVESVGRVWRAGRDVEVRVSAGTGSGRRTFAATVCSRLGAQLLAVDLRAADPSTVDATVLLAHRELPLLGLYPCFVTDRPLPAHVAPPVPLRFVVQQDADATDDGPASGPQDPVVLRVALPAMSGEERAALLAEVTPALVPADRLVLARRHRLRIGEVRDLLASGARGADAVAAASEAAARARLAGLGSVLPTPVVPGDLVLDETTTRALATVLAEARVRTEVLAPGQGGRGTGLTVLFHGSPGTGKTMAALVLAATLGLPLVRVDVATVLSRYIGETAKILRRIFREAREIDGVLFFDEADTLFARRTELRDANDRHANADTGYLLTLLEEHEGVTVLASNQRTNLDPAVQRRLRHVVEFNPPGPQERTRLWSAAVHRAGVARDRVGPELCVDLAETVELSGAQIQAAVLTATFLAADRTAAVDRTGAADPASAVGRAGEDVVAADLIRAVEVELAKGGRSLRTADRTRLLHHG